MRCVVSAPPAQEARSAPRRLGAKRRRAGKARLFTRAARRSPPSARRYAVMFCCHGARVYSGAPTRMRRANAIWCSVLYARRTRRRKVVYSSTAMMRHVAAAAKSCCCAPLRDTRAGGTVALYRHSTKIAEATQNQSAGIDGRNARVKRDGGI